MTKKIISIVLACILIAGCFAGCGKKENQVVSHNKEYEAVKDKDGNYIYDDDGYIAVYQKDENGKKKKNEDGEPMTVYVKAPKEITSDTAVETPNYKVDVKDNSWELINSKYYKKDTEQKVVYSVIDYYPLDEKNSNLLEYVNSLYETEATKEFLKNLAEQGYTEESLIEEIKITDAQVDAVYNKYTIKDKDGNVQYHGESIYSKANDKLLIIEYTCNEGKYYDADFDMKSFVNKNLTIKTK